MRKFQLMVVVAVIAVMAVAQSADAGVFARIRAARHPQCGQPAQVQYAQPAQVRYVQPAQPVQMQFAAPEVQPSPRYVLPVTAVRNVVSSVCNGPWCPSK